MAFSAFKDLLDRMGGQSGGVALQLKVQRGKFLFQFRYFRRLRRPGLKPLQHFTRQRLRRRGVL